jgi:hypothetical protein
VRRVVVLGGLGLFGRTAAEELRGHGIAVKTASRSAAADIRVDANNIESIRATIRSDDVVLDAAGPFHLRSTALIRAAIEIGFDVIDINDNLGYAESVVAMEPRIAAAGIRVLSSASTVSAVAAAVLRHSQVAEPRYLAAYLAPASRHTANVGTALSLINSVGQPVRVFRDGRLQTRIGWSERSLFLMPKPVGWICGRLYESADSLYLPRIWPTLGYVDMYVDTNTRGMNSLLRLAAHSNLVRNLMQRGVRLGTALAKLFGARAGGVAYAIGDAAANVECYAVIAKENSFLTAVAPAVLAARAIAEERFFERGLVAPDRQVEPAELIAYLKRAGITLSDT